VLDRATGAVVKAFDPRELRDALRDARLIGYGGGDQFWAVSPTRYELELWSVEGTLLGGIRRRAAWFHDNDEGLMSTTGARILYLYVDAVANVLWVTIIVFERPRDLNEEGVEPGDYSIRVEAFSTRSGQLLISERFAADPLAFFPGVAPGVAYGINESASGIPMITVLEYRLVARGE
jgi:hypothetical protein